MRYDESEFYDPADLAVQAAPDMSDLIDTTADYVLERFHPTRFASLQAWANAVAEWHDAEVELAGESAKSGVLRRVIMKLISSFAGDVRISVLGLAFAIGANRLLKWNTLSAAAESLGCTRSALSKVQVRWEDDLSLKRSVHGRSSENRELLSQVQKKKHWRRAKKLTVPDPVPDWERTPAVVVLQDVVGNTVNVTSGLVAVNNNKKQ